LSSPQKAKRVYSNSQKEQILREHLEHGLSISAISRKHQINAVTLYAWKKMLMGPSKDKKSPEEQAEIEKLRREVEALKKVISDLAIDNSILKEANEILKKKQTTPAWFRSPKK
jgi:transposase-like protein